MAKPLILILTLCLTINLKAQDFDRNIILKHKIKEIHESLKADSAFIFDSIIIYKYDEQGLLVEETHNASPLYPTNTLAITKYVYDDTILQEKIESTWLDKKLISSDTVYYYYDSLNRLEFIYNAGHHLVFEILDRFQYYRDTKTILKKSHYLRDSPNRSKPFQSLSPLPAICPYTFKNGKVFYLDFFEMYTSGNRIGVENRKLRYDKCRYDTIDCKYCLSQSEVFLNFGDTLKEKILYENAMSYNELENSKFECDSTGWFSPATTINKITTEKYFNNNITEQHVKNLKSYNRDFDGEGDIYYFYTSQNLLIRTKKKWTITDADPIKFTLITTYHYEFYE